MLPFIRYKQVLKDSRITDVEGELYRQLEKMKPSLTFSHGQTVGIAVGSRGITNLSQIVSQIVKTTKEWGLNPFIIPAMGSHGGASAAGQIEVLTSFGITEAKMACPIISSMEVVHLGETNNGAPIYVSEAAVAADHLIIVNRIKPHTLFSGPIESGLLKMMVVGLGKHTGALAFHAEMKKQHPSRILEEMAQRVMEKCQFMFGVSIVENGFDQTAIINVLKPNEMIEQEKRLLEEAKSLMPSLPFHEFDLLIVDEIGKDISGSGLDPNIIGRYWDQPISDPEIGRIFVRDTSKKTHGNVIGIGRADFTTERLVRKIDYQATYTNSITSGHPESARLPIHFETDREVLEAVIQSLGGIPIEKIRACWIKNTLEISEMLISPSLIKSAGLNQENILGEPFIVQFDDQGILMRPGFDFEKGSGH